MDTLGNADLHAYHAGDRDVIDLMYLEEANRLHAWKLAQAHSWWDDSVDSTQILLVFYEHTGRIVEWIRLVDEVMPHFVDPTTNGPIAGREKRQSR
jgi:hypothetical protein